jgi:hypothetical protein
MMVIPESFCRGSMFSIQLQSGFRTETCRMTAFSTFARNPTFCLVFVHGEVTAVISGEKIYLPRHILTYGNLSRQQYTFITLRATGLL